MGLNAKEQEIINKLANHLASIDTKLDNLNNGDTVTAIALTAIAAGIVALNSTLSGVLTLLQYHLPIVGEVEPARLMDTLLEEKNVLNDANGQRAGMLEDVALIKGFMEPIQLVMESVSVNTLAIGRNQQVLVVCCGENNNGIPLPIEEAMPANLCQRLGWIMDRLEAELNGLIRIVDIGQINSVIVSGALDEVSRLWQPIYTYPAVVSSVVTSAMLDGMDAFIGVAERWASEKSDAKQAVALAISSDEVKTLFDAFIDDATLDATDKLILKALLSQSLANYVWSGLFDNDVYAYPNDCAELTYETPFSVGTGSSRTILYNLTEETYFSEIGKWYADFGALPGATSLDATTTLSGFHLPFERGVTETPCKYIAVGDFYLWQVKIAEDTYGQRLWTNTGYLDVTPTWQTIFSHTTQIYITDEADDGVTKPSWTVQFREPVLP